jgi:hypothetical protein
MKRCKAWREAAGSDSAGHSRECEHSRLRARHSFGVAGIVPRHGRVGRLPIRHMEAPARGGAGSCGYRRTRSDCRCQQHHPRTEHFEYRDTLRSPGHGDQVNSNVEEDSVRLLADESLAGHRYANWLIRKALLVALRYGKHTEVRLNALNDLRPYVAKDTRVRDGFLEALLNDPTSTVRSRAIELLQPVEADSSVREAFHTMVPRTTMLRFEQSPARFLINFLTWSNRGISSRGIDWHARLSNGQHAASLDVSCPHLVLVRTNSLRCPK